MKYNKFFRVFLLIIAGMIAGVWDILFYIVTHVYMICKVIDAWGERKLEEFGGWYDSPRE